MGEDKKGEKGKGGGSVAKFLLALILLGALVVGGSVPAAKFSGHPEWNLVTRILDAVQKAQEHKP